LDDSYILLCTLFHHHIQLANRREGLATHGDGIGDFKFNEFFYSSVWGSESAAVLAP